ncbi:MAG TPA: NAD(P)-dependent oxidoreductase, partial [Clostridia bacterium]|nr:NAD(P)-dependent oxidoreductase [Clostridia bacterium]
MKVLITGAYGNIGKAVLEEVLARGHEVTVFEQKSRRTVKAAKQYSNRINKTIFGDIVEYSNVKEAVRGMDAVIHLAAIIPPASRNRELCYMVNVDGTANVAKAIVEDGDKAVLIHSSSCSVMGPTQAQEPPVRVDQKPKPIDDYTKSKVISEEKVRSSGVTRYCITRLGAVMPSKGVWKFSTLAYGFEFPFYSRIEMVLDSDVGLAQITAAEKLKLNVIESGNIYFLGGGDRCRLTYGEFMNGLLGAIGIPALKKESFTCKENFLDWLDTKKAQIDLSFQRYTFEDYKRIFRNNMRRYLPFTKLFGRLVKWIINQKSPYY